MFCAFIHVFLNRASNNDDKKDFRAESAVVRMPASPRASVSEHARTALHNSIPPKSAAARARPSALRRNLVREKPFPAPSEPKAPFPRHHPGRVSGLAGKRCLLLYRMGGNKNNAHQSSTPKHGSRRRFMLLRKQEQCPPDTIRVGMDAIQSRDPAVIRGSVSAVAKILHHCANGCILVSGV